MRRPSSRIASFLSGIVESTFGVIRRRSIFSWRIRDGYLFSLTSWSRTGIGVDWKDDSLLFWTALSGRNLSAN